MYPRNPQRNIVLCGFYRSGKSAVGREVAQLMRRPFMDMEVEVRRRMKAGLRRLLMPHTVHNSQEIERKLVSELSYKRGWIAALGSESIDNQLSITELSDFSLTVFLDPPFDVLWQRILDHNGDLSAAAAAGSTDKQAMLETWRDMRVQYERCDLQLTSPHASVKQTAKFIMHCFYT